jgi:hypothetical protein
MSDDAYKKLGLAEAIFKDLIWDNLIRAGKAALFSAAPWMSVWPLGPMINLLIDMFTDKLYEGLRLAIDLEAIVFVNEAHRRAYDKAAVTLKILAQEKGIDSPEFKNAKEYAKADLSKFVRFGT